MPEKKAFTCVLNTPNLIFVPKSLKIEHPPPPSPKYKKGKKTKWKREKNKRIELISFYMTKVKIFIH